MDYVHHVQTTSTYCHHIITRISLKHTIVWQPGLVVAHWSRPTKLLYTGPS